MATQKSKFSPNTRCLFSKIKRICKALLNCNTNLDQKESGVCEKDTDTEIDPNLMSTRYQLVTQLNNCAFALIEHRLHQDYGEYLAKTRNSLEQPDNRMRMKELEAFLYKEHHLSWPQIAAHLQHETSTAPISGTLPPSPPANTPWLDALSTAATILRSPLTADQLRHEISEHARRRNRIADLVATNDPCALAATILHDLDDLAIVFPSAAARAHMQRAILRLADRYFVVCAHGCVQPRSGAWPKRETAGW